MTGKTFKSKEELISFLKKYEMEDKDSATGIHIEDRNVYTNINNILTWEMYKTDFYIQGLLLSTNRLQIGTSLPYSYWFINFEWFVNIRRDIGLNMNFFNICDIIYDQNTEMKEIKNKQFSFLQYDEFRITEEVMSKINEMVKKGELSWNK